MSTKLNRIQIKDIAGDAIKNSNRPILITSSTTTVIFTGVGLLMGVLIWKDVDGGTIYFTDADDAAITGIPNSTYKGMLDYPGNFPVPNIELTNGLKVVTENATGLVMSIFSAT